MKPKTYAETKNEKPFDWFKALNKKVITDEEWESYSDKSMSWVTCACGNQCSIIERDNYGEPIDEILSKLGGDIGFHGAIIRQNKKEALKFLKLIEERSTILIKEKVKEAQEIVKEYSKFLK